MNILWILIVIEWNITGKKILNVPRQIKMCHVSKYFWKRWIGRFKKNISKYIKYLKWNKF